MKKRILTLIIFALVAVALVSCSKEKNPPMPEAAPDHIHEFSAWTILKDVTCDVDGLKTRFCECGEIQVEAITAPGHRVGNWVIEEADCENDGIKYRKCKTCKKELDREVLEAFGHEYVAEVTDPTHDLVGYTTYTCSICSHVFISDYLPSWGIQELLFSVNSDNKTCTVVKVVQTDATEILMPESLGGYTVTAIGNSAFENCDLLETVYIPATVKSIGNKAFSGCVSLTNVYFENVTSIGNYAFENCASLEEIKLYPDTVFLGEGAFTGCAALTEVSLPNTITQIPAFVFEGCSALASVEFNKSATSIGESAFSGCASLAAVPDITNVGFIGDAAFAGCKSLASVNLGSTLSYVGTNAFLETEGLKKVYAPSLEDWFCISFANGAANPLNESAELCIKNRVVKTLVVPSSVSVISDYQFYGYDYLASVEIPDTVIAIGDYVFANCVSLKTAEFAGYITDMGDGTFFGCEALESVELPEKLTSISKSTFSGCVNLISVVVPAGVKVIEKEAFYGCSSLNSVDFGNSLLKIDDRAFYGCANLESITFPETLTAISNMAFANCSKIALLELPDSVIYVGFSAFEDCAEIEAVTMSEGIKVISANAFAGCNKVADVYIKDLNSWYKVSFGNAEANPIHNKCNFYVDGELVTELIISSDVRSISDYAFCDAGSINEIYFNGTAAEYDSVIGNNNLFLEKMILSESVYYYSSVEPTDEGDYWYYNEFGRICKW